jgi:phage replication-related protein YjqB (UPF0714/DUF867 family)
LGDTYSGFDELKQHEEEGRDFDIKLRNVGSSIVIVAPHGGGIEPGTSEIADAIAGAEFSFYAFEGRKTNSRILHITSTRFDEPKCLTLIREARTVITVHGRDAPGKVVLLGGRDLALGTRVEGELKKAGFTTTKNDEPAFQGLSSQNICNLGKSGAGVQLELSLHLRRAMFKSLSREGRKQSGDALHAFRQAIRNALGSM